MEGTWYITNKSYESEERHKNVKLGATEMFKGIGNTYIYWGK